MIYEAIIRDDRVEWIGERPEVRGPVKVTVTVPDDKTLDTSDVETAWAPPSTEKPLEEMDLKEIFEELVRLDPFRDIDDPVAWQREIRKDRPLPGRED